MQYGPDLSCATRKAARETMELKPRRRLYSPAWMRKPSRDASRTAQLCDARLADRLTGVPSNHMTECRDEHNRTRYRPLGHAGTPRCGRRTPCETNMSPTLGRCLVVAGS